ncbi:MAG TPA: PadR family transcriptional regulator [Terracidiphilus sp.]|jgi:DNA-binding PadR family transcriptional regulator|nr:PadR family transcriptional regulator [Terracidiphilus sp.]
MELSRTSYVVLGMLAVGGDRSGYDIRKAIESSVGYFWGESYGQIYPALKQLAAKKLIKPGSDSGKPLSRAKNLRRDGGRKRRQTWRITAAGRSILRDWLAAPFQNDPPRNEFLLKLFFGAEANPEVSVAHIRELEQRNLQALRAMEQIEAIAPTVNAAEPGLKYWMLTLRLGMAITRAALEWGRQALAELEGDNAVKQPQTSRTSRSH